MTRLLLMVVAIDDAVGLVLFSVSFGIAGALEQGRIDPLSVVAEPIVEILLAGLGRSGWLGAEQAGGLLPLRSSA